MTACLKSLSRCGDEAALRADLAALAAAFPRREILRAAVDAALGGGPVRALDPKRERKAGPLRMLAEALRGA